MLSGRLVITCDTCGKWCFDFEFSGDWHGVAKKEMKKKKVRGQLTLAGKFTCKDCAATARLSPAWSK